MYYETFPFGKYKGTKLKDLPSTYIVFAVESFDLPQELDKELWQIFLGRHGNYTAILEALNKQGEKEFKKFLTKKISEYERD